ncbi:MAG: SCO family protein [Anaerolineales bacterium]|nr:SCO family protein [Anaerolineales bacterium]
MNTKLLWVGLGLLVLIGLVMVAVWLFPKTDTFRGTLYDPALPAPEIALSRDNGSNFRLSEQRGDVVLLFFGYTSCPDVCPTTLSELRKVNMELGSNAGRVKVVFVTVDPERDTPEQIQKYVSIFNPAFVGLSGSLEELEPVWKNYGVYREVEQVPSSAAGYLVNHTARVYLIDRDGNLRLSYSYGTPTDDILHDLKILFK